MYVCMYVRTYLPAPEEDVVDEVHEEVKERSVDVFGQGVALVSGLHGVQRDRDGLANAKSRVLEAQRLGQSSHIAAQQTRSLTIT
jgi:hypothetical protein